MGFFPSPSVGSIPEVFSEMWSMQKSHLTKGANKETLPLCVCVCASCSGVGVPLRCSCVDTDVTAAGVN